MKESNRGLWVIVILVCLAAAGAAFFAWNRVQQEVGLMPPAPEASASPSAAPSELATHYPLPESEEGEAEEEGASARATPTSRPSPAPLPALDESDPAALAELTALLGKGRAEPLLNLDQLVRRTVVTVNSARDRRQLSQEFSLFKPAPGTLAVTQGSDGQSIDLAKNSARYAAYISLVQAVDARKLAAAYMRLYPLFQAAYKDQGLKGYFNDRLVEAIDLLLETPEPRTPARVYSTSVYFKFSEPSLESLAAGQKVLVRIGPEAEAMVKGKLRQFRARITRLGAGR